MLPERRTAPPNLMLRRYQNGEWSSLLREQLLWNRLPPLADPQEARRDGVRLEVEAAQQRDLALHKRVGGPQPDQLKILRRRGEHVV